MCFLPASVLCTHQTEAALTYTNSQTCVLVCACAPFDSCSELIHFSRTIRHSYYRDASTNGFHLRLHKVVMSATKHPSIVLNKDRERLSDGFSRCMLGVIAVLCAAAYPPVSDGGV